DYEQNQRLLEANGAMREGQTGGAAKRGSALLSGLLRCGRCGRPLFVAYSGPGGRVPRYACHASRGERGSASCLYLGALRGERAVADQVLQAGGPAGVQAALAAAEQLEQTQQEQQQTLALALERARYEAERARRQYDAVEPENRLVAGELERRWNTAL